VAWTVAVSITIGLILFQFGSMASAYIGGVGTQRPGESITVYLVDPLVAVIVVLDQRRIAAEMLSENWMVCVSTSLGKPLSRSVHYLIPFIHAAFGESYRSTYFHISQQCSKSKSISAPLRRHWFNPWSVLPMNCTRRIAGSHRLIRRQCRIF
jgi:hypothetical protein